MTDTECFYPAAASSGGRHKTTKRTRRCVNITVQKLPGKIETAAVFLDVVAMWHTSIVLVSSTHHVIRCASWGGLNNFTAAAIRGGYSRGLHDGLHQRQVPGNAKANHIQV